MAYSNLIAFMILVISVFLLLLLFYSQFNSNFTLVNKSKEEHEKQQYVFAEHQKVEISRISVQGVCNTSYNLTIRAVNKGSAIVNLNKSNLQLNGNFVSFTSSKSVINPGSYVDLYVNNLISNGSDRVSLTTDSGAIIYYGYNCSELLCNSNVTFSNWYYNSTYAGKETNFSIYFSDNDGTNAYRFLFDNCTGTYIDRTGWKDAYNTYSNIYFTTKEILNSTVNCTIRARIEVKDRCENLEYKELLFNTTNLTCISDAVSLNGWVVSTIYAGYNSNVSINITDNDNITSYVFGLDNGTGTYVYDSPVYLPSGQKSLNFSKLIQLNDNPNKLIRLIITVNDSCNISTSFVQEFLTTSQCGFNSEFISSTFNNTVAGRITKFSFIVWDEDNITGYQFFFDNGTGNFVPDLYVSIPNATNPVIEINKTLNSTIGSTIRAILMVNDSCGNLVNSSMLVFNTTQLCSINTSFSNWSVNTTVRDYLANFSISINDSDGIKSYIFWFDNGTGIYVNDSEVNLTNYPTIYNFSIVKRLNSTVGSTIRAKLLVKDNCSNIVNSSELIFNTIYPCPYVINSSEILITDLNCPDTAIIINGSNLTLDCNYKTVSFGSVSSGRGIVNLDTRNNVTILRCILNGSGLVENNIGIELNNSNNISIENTIFNILSNNGTGLLGRNVKYLLIRNTSILGTSNFYGMNLVNSSNLLFTNITTEPNISIVNSSNITFNSSNIFNSYSNVDKKSFILNVTNLSLVNSNFTGTWQEIINCYSNCNISYNKFSNAKTGINIHNTTNLTFIGNEVYAINKSSSIRYPGQNCLIKDNIFSSITASTNLCPFEDTIYNYSSCVRSTFFVNDMYLCNFINNTAYVVSGHGMYFGFNNSYSNVSYAYAYVNSTERNRQSVMFIYARNFMNYTNIKANGSGISIFMSYNSTFKNVTSEKSSREGLLIYHHARNITFEDFNIESTNSTGLMLRGDYPSPQEWPENYTALSMISNITMRNINITVFDNYEQDPNNPKLQTWASYGMFITNTTNSTFENISIYRTFNGIGRKSYYDHEPYSIVILGWGGGVNNITFRNVHFNDTRNQIWLYGVVYYSPVGGDIGDIYFENTSNFARNISNIFDKQYNRPTDNITFRWPIKINVTDINGNPIQSANVTLRDSFGNLYELNLTNSNGLTNDFIATDATFLDPNEHLALRQPIIDYNLHVVRAEKTGYWPNSTQVNITSNAIFNLTLLTPIACAYPTSFEAISHNSTIQGSSVNFSLWAYDYDNISAYQFCIDNATSTFVCDPWIPYTNAKNLVASVVKTINSTLNKTIRYYFNIRDQCNNLVSSQIKSFVTTSRCTYYTIINPFNWTTTVAGETTNISVNATDLDGITAYNFYFYNGSGNYVNDGWTSYSGNYLNFSTLRVLNSTPNTQINFYISIIDSCNNYVNAHAGFRTT